MSEPVKRFTQVAGGLHGGLWRDPNGDWCRYEPRFDEPQLSREEVDLIEWAWSWVTNNTVMRGAIVTSRLGKLRQLITRLRAQPQASPWVPCSERMPEAKALGREFWTTDGQSVVIAEFTAVDSHPWALGGFTPTHWAPIVRPELPK